MKEEVEEIEETDGEDRAVQVIQAASENKLKVDHDDDGWKIRLGKTVIGDDADLVVAIEAALTAPGARKFRQVLHLAAALADDKDDADLDDDESTFVDAITAQLFDDEEEEDDDEEEEEPAPTPSGRTDRVRVRRG